VFVCHFRVLIMTQKDNYANRYWNGLQIWPFCFWKWDLGWHQEFEVWSLTYNHQKFSGEWKRLQLQQARPKYQVFAATTGSSQNSLVSYRSARTYSNLIWKRLTLYASTTKRKFGSVWPRMALHMAWKAFRFQTIFSSTSSYPMGYNPVVSRRQRTA